MPTAKSSPFESIVRSLALADGSKIEVYSLSAIGELGLPDPGRLPYSVKVLLESALRNCDGLSVTEAVVRALAGWTSDGSHQRTEIAFKPARVLLQDFTGVPCVVDLAALRSAMQRLGKDPARIEPAIAVDLVIDHSIQVDKAASSDAIEINSAMEFTRNRERYEFLRWGQSAFETLRIFPPGVGIVHQVNLEYLATVVALSDKQGRRIAFPDSLVGTDSHTTMINGLGVLGWGVGGIEAEAVMLGQPIYTLLPEVVGLRLTGELPEGVTATDLTLTVTELLRAKGVVGKFVEFFGPGLAKITLADRATMANMAPEYGATMGFFPIDDQTLTYLRQTGRSADQIDLIERYAKEQGLFRSDSGDDPDFSDVLECDLSAIQSSVAGPKRPQDRVVLEDLKESFRRSLSAPTAERGFGLDEAALSASVPCPANGSSVELKHGSVVIAAITSCTNTSNPSVMLAAGLVAKKAAQKGLKVSPHVKTSLAPGSRVVTEYLTRCGLIEPLQSLGFHVVGYGCTTCIGNSGPLSDAVTSAVKKGELVAASVLSGNRNFEGRINSMTQANYLASPPLVVAFALAGTVDIDLRTEALGRGSGGEEVFLRDIWPTGEEIRQAMEKADDPETYQRLYANVLDVNPRWNEIKVESSSVYAWDEASTYIHEPPFFLNFKEEPDPVQDIAGARVLLMLGDSITTDHISPAGAFGPDSPAGRYLIGRGVQPKDFNTYGARRGDDRVMTRGTFANIRIKNLLVPGVEGGVTIHHESGERMDVYDAALRYGESATPLIVLAGKEYGTGSSRDWAAKGPKLLGVRAVIAESYERIHRSNLVFMGILPLQFRAGESAASLGLTGTETYRIEGLEKGLEPGAPVAVRAQPGEGAPIEFETILRIDTPIEIEYFKNGGILDYVLREYMKT